MSELWIRNPGAGDEYGPLTLAQLRRLAEVGLILEETVVHDGRCDVRRITAWPELLEALADESAETWVGAPDKPKVNRGPRTVAKAGMPGEIRMGEEAVLKLDRGERKHAVVADVGESVSVKRVLAENVLRELHYVPVSPPWYRYPVARNAGRGLAFVVPVGIVYGIALAAGALKFGFGMRMEDAGMFTLMMGAITLWSWQVWIIEPCRWRMFKPGSTSEYLQSGSANEPIAEVRG